MIRMYVCLYIYISNHACIRNKNNAPRKLRNWISTIKHKNVLFSGKAIRGSQNHQPPTSASRSASSPVPFTRKMERIGPKVSSRSKKMPKSSTSKAIWSKIHPGRLTWNIIIEVWKIIFLSKWVICMFHVNLPGCNKKGWQLSWE